MCLEESFSPFTRDAAENICRTAPPLFRFPAVITAQCDAPFNIPLYQCAFCSVSAHAHQKNIVRSNNAPTGNFYVV